VSDLEKSKHFYVDVQEAKLYREYGVTSWVLSFQGSWLLLVTGGGPTKDKPEVTFRPPEKLAVAEAAPFRLREEHEGQA
jgi:catechol 2,3-dioxygenase-like lactoylglutathione lyase family enzyme